MRELTREDIAEDLGIAVGVGGKAGIRRDPVFIQYLETAMGLMIWLIVAPEGEGMFGVEPPKVPAASLGRPAWDDPCV